MNKQNISLAIVMAIVLIFGAVPITTSVQAEDDGEFVDDSGEDGSGDSGGESTDDGYVYPDDSTPEEQQDIDEQEQEAYEDAGSPGEEQITCPDGTVVNSGDYCPDVIICPDGSTVAVGQECTADVPTALVPPVTSENAPQTFTCSDGSIVTGDAKCPSTGPLPYCDTDAGKAATSCHDRYDYDDGTGLAPCNDGTQKANPLDCKDATEKDLPRCEYKVVKDCTLNDLGQPCNIGTSEDACQDIFYGYDGSKYKPGEKIKDNGPDAENKIETIPPQTPAFCPNGPDGNAPAGTCGTPTPTSTPKSELKTCSDGTLAMSCGMIGYARK